MKNSILKFALSITVLAALTSSKVLGADLNASNHNELENVLLQQMSSYNQDFTIKYTGSLDNIENILTKSISKDTYINSNVKSISWELNGTTKLVNINVDVDYIITSSQRVLADKQIDSILSEIIKPYMNDHEKVLAIHDYIVIHSKYDESMQRYSDYELLTEGTSVCNGYALLTYNMLQKLNIPVQLVTGAGNGELHIWNMVKLGDYWFHLDTTWNDSLPDTDTLSYDYYMLTDKEILKDHTIDENLDIPKATKSYYEYLTELSQDKILIKTGLDIYDAENTAENEGELANILENKIKYRPLKISVRINKSLSQDTIYNAMSGLFKYDYISEIGYGQLKVDNTGKYQVLNLYIKYKETPESIYFDFKNQVYSTASSVKYNIYATFGSRKVNITDNVLIYPNNQAGLSINNGTIRFNKPGSYPIEFQYQGLNQVATITALNSDTFKYITDTKPKNPVNVKVYDQYIDFSSVGQWPFIENGRTMVPLRAVFEVMNCNVSWEQAKNAAIVKYEDTSISIVANSNTAYINGKATTLDVPAKLVNNRIMVPLRFISEAINKTVVWDHENSTVLIY